LLERQKVNFVHLAKQLNISRATLYNYFETEEIPRKKLEKVCTAAGIDVNEIYQSEVNDPAAELRAKVKTLEEMVRDKEVIIVQQREIIELLKKSKTKK